MINIKSDEHLFICGITGSGKTNISKLLWRGIQPGHGIIIDVKHELGAYGRIARTVAEIDKILNSGFNAVFQGQNTQENYAAIFHYAYQRGNVVIWIDEGWQVIPEGRTCQEAIDLFTAGRSRGAVAWTLTQRPAIVSKTAIAQSSHYFVYNLMLYRDKKAICDNIPLELDDFRKLNKYEFFYYCQGMTIPEHCAPVAHQK